MKRKMNATIEVKEGNEKAWKMIENVTFLKTKKKKKWRKSFSRNVKAMLHVKYVQSVIPAVLIIYKGYKRPILQRTWPLTFLDRGNRKEHGI